ncbi:MAG: hypothetical protein Q9N34_02770 [Aquificota bacterium]|nr:hypothetical protein [Aquificota bacterium]
MAVKDIMDTLRGISLEEAGINQRASDLVKDIKLIGSELTFCFTFPRRVRRE